MTHSNSDRLKSLMDAEAQAKHLFEELDARGMIRAGIAERALNLEIYNLAFELFGIKKYWHKRIVRAGENTLYPYHENPPNLMIEDGDILFLDFGPVFDEWEADFGRTYVLGTDPLKLKLQSDIMEAWQRGKQFFEEHRSQITGAQLYTYVSQMAIDYGWSFGNEHCGHLIGHFPHEHIAPEKKKNYLHPENDRPLKPKGEKEPYWILEIHFVDREKRIGGFTEQLLG